jgi:hypothetical protein
MKTPILPFCNTYQLHIYGGANHSITNNPCLLLQYKNIKPYYMSSASEQNDMKCTVVGYLQWRSPGGTMLLVNCFYSTKAPDTIISPSNIVLNHLTDYHSWTQHADITKKLDTSSFKTIQQSNISSTPSSCKMGYGFILWTITPITILSIISMIML